MKPLAFENQNIKLLKKQTGINTVRDNLIVTRDILQVKYSDFTLLTKKNFGQDIETIKLEIIKNDIDLIFNNNNINLKFERLIEAIENKNYNLFNTSLKYIKIFFEDNLEKINNEISNIITNQLRYLNKSDLINQINVSETEHLFTYFIYNFNYIISSPKDRIGLISKDDFTDKVIIQKFNDFERFINVINCRIDSNEINSDIEKIEQLPDVTFVNKTKFLENLYEFLYKNAFIELSYSIYSFKFKNYVSYFDLEELIKRLYETDNKVKDTKELEFRFQVRKSFHSKNKVDFSKKILELESFNCPKYRKKILYLLISNCVNFKDSLISNHKKTKILKPLYKRIYLAVFYHHDNDSSDTSLIKKLTEIRRSLKTKS